MPVWTLHMTVSPLARADAARRCSHQYCAHPDETSCDSGLPLANRPFQRHDGLFGSVTTGRQQMRNSIIDRQFKHLWIDHDEPALFRLQPVKAKDRIIVLIATDLPEPWYRQQEGAASSPARRQRARHQLSCRGKAQASSRFRVIRRLDQFSEINRFPNRVGQFDADDVTARHHSHAGRKCRHRAGNIIRQADNAGRLDAGAGSNS